MIVIPGRIPISIHPIFWLFAGLIGWLNSQSIIGALIWIGIILVSVLFHEFGHALTALAFRQKTQIQLVALGGVTSYDGPKLKFWQQFIIVLNGPLAGIGLFFLATLALYLPLPQPLYGIVKMTQIVNLFWSIINLVPVLPLDGGQLLRIALEAFFGVKGLKASLLVGMIIAVCLSFYFFIVQAFLVGALFFLFAFQSFDLWRKSRLISPSDRQDNLKNELIEGENCLQRGDKAKAEELFKEVYQKAPGGMLAAAASQYLAFLYADRGKKDEAYEMLFPIRKNLSDESLCLLHQLAAERGNHELVAELSADCYQSSPNRDIAVQNARAFAHLGQPQPAGGWLQTAWQHGSFDLNQLLNEQVFAKVRDDPLFRQFVDPLHEK